VVMEVLDLKEYTEDYKFRVRAWSNTDPSKYVRDTSFDMDAMTPTAVEMEAVAPITTMAGSNGHHVTPATPVTPIPRESDIMTVLEHRGTSGTEAGAESANENSTAL